MNNLNEEKLNIAIRQLEIRTNNTADDREQLSKILIQILGYPYIQDAEYHHRASNMGQNDLLARQHQLELQIRQKNIKSYEVCSCCGLLIRNQQLQYCVDFEELKIGMGVILFFKNYLFTAGLFVAMFFIYSIYAFATNIQASNVNLNTDNFLCLVGVSGQVEDSSCGISSIGGGSKVLNTNENKDDWSYIQSWLGFAFVLLWGIANVTKAHLEKKLVIDMETKRVSASDFTLMITGIPKVYLANSYDQNLNEIKTIFNTYSRKIGSIFSYQVIKYNIGRPLFSESSHQKQKKQQIQKTLKNHQKTFRDWIYYRKLHLKFPVPFQKRDLYYQKYIEFYSSQYDVLSLSQVPLEQKNIVFITLRSSKAAEEICNLNKPPSWKNFWNLCSQSQFPIHGVTIYRSPEPEQINWMKIGFPLRSKYIRKALLWIFTLVLIGASLGISLGIAFAKVSTQVSIGISLVVTIVNVGIQMAIMFLSYLQNEFISSKQQSKIAFKIGIGQTINSIGVPVLVTLLANADSRIPDKSWLGQGGLNQDVFFIAIFNLAVPIGRFIDPFEIFLKIRRWWYSKPYHRLEMYGQAEFNKYFGNYEFDIGYEYAYLIKTTIFTSFFACMQPIIILFAPIGLILYYFADKRNLLRHFQRPTYFYATINRSVDSILLFAPIAFGFGHLLVNNFIREELDYHRNGTLLANWLMVAAGGIFVLLVILNIFYCCIERPEYPQWDYFEKKPIIPTDYDRMNPLTKVQAIGQFESYLKQLQQKQELPDQGQMLMLKMSNLRVTNQRRGQKKQLNADLLRSSIRKSGNNLPSNKYNTDLNQYNHYLNKNQHGMREQSSYQLGHMTNSVSYKNELNYPQLNDQKIHPRNR